jgi:hypothetical protein
MPLLLPLLCCQTFFQVFAWLLVWTFGLPTTSLLPALQIILHPLSGCRTCSRNGEIFWFHTCLLAVYISTPGKRSLFVWNKQSNAAEIFLSCNVLINSYLPSIWRVVYFCRAQINRLASTLHYIFVKALQLKLVHLWRKEVVKMTAILILDNQVHRREHLSEEL